MTSLTITDSELDGIKDQVVLITGLATLRRVISHGGKVFASDVNPLPEPEASSVPFIKANVTSWKEQLDMFKAAEKEYGKIDHVFANAGIPPSTTLLEEDVDEKGDLLPPKLDTMNVNLTGCMYTVKLGIHYIKSHANGGTTTKHGILGLVRALYTQLYPKIPIRLNAIAPSWTDTAIIPREVVAFLGEGNCQSADAVAQSVVLLMADGQRHGQVMYSDKGRFWEMEDGETGYHALTKKMLDTDAGIRRVVTAHGQAAAGSRLVLGFGPPPQSRH
ncbi:NAD(P)-binding protein [Decorospora gaudefroyi]|uniref:NAD(P)-binding protein n=1 Tax=Decorospora gaudefroyi TaxID=184978 RepID=A0A6A5KYQ4_9PLEO|nr:NAD(P)-binding protein [Decorospora gaudefroyi]